MPKLRIPLIGAAALLVLAGLAESAQAQSYPSKPLRMVVAFAPGGPTDTMARLIADKLGDKLGQRIVVENRAGAGGNIGYESVAKSPPDGYTLAYVDPSLTVNPTLYNPPKFNAEKDFTPISAAVRGPTVMVVPGTSEAKTVGAFIALARTKAGQATFGTPGAGTRPISTPSSSRRPRASIWFTCPTRVRRPR
jgi:tripartite-type tricarboxylate transporter receptor subunit TctC